LALVPHSDRQLVAETLIDLSTVLFLVAKCESTCYWLSSPRFTPMKLC